MYGEYNHYALAIIILYALRYVNHLLKYLVPMIVWNKVRKHFSQKDQIMEKELVDSSDF